MDIRLLINMFQLKKLQIKSSKKLPAQIASPWKALDIWFVWHSSVEGLFSPPHPPTIL